MSRNLSVALKTHLAGEVLTLCDCVKLTRRDGTVMGFTTLDQDVVLGSVTYEALNAMTGSSVQQKAGTGVDNLEIIGIISSDRITEADIRAGVYDGASVELLRINWADTSQGAMTMLKGIIGEINLQDGQFTAELRSLSQRLLQQIGELTGPLCRVVRLGDTRCKVSLTAFTHTGTISAVTSQADVTLTGLSGSPGGAGYFDYGLLKLTSGANSGIEREIKRHTVSGGARIELQEAFPFALSAGQSVQVTAGCDRRFSTCVSKFSNAVNFRGEPHIPGSDQLSQRGRGAA